MSVTDERVASLEAAVRGQALRTFDGFAAQVTPLAFGAWPW